MLAALSFPAEKKPPLLKLQMWNSVLSMRQYLRLLPNFHFRFRLCASFRGGSVFRDPPCTGTSHNHFASQCDIFDGSPLLTAERKQIRVQMAIERSQILSVQSACQWHDIITLNESWIYLFSEHDLMWTDP
jgi:hypothetical protein